MFDPEWFNSYLEEFIRKYLHNYNVDELSINKKVYEKSDFLKRGLGSLLKKFSNFRHYTRDGNFYFEGKQVSEAGYYKSLFEEFFSKFMHANIQDELEDDFTCSPEDAEDFKINFVKYAKPDGGLKLIDYSDMISTDNELIYSILLNGSISKEEIKVDYSTDDNELSVKILNESAVYCTPPGLKLNSKPCFELINNVLTIKFNK